MLSQPTGQVNVEIGVPVNGESGCYIGQRAPASIDSQQPVL